MLNATAAATASIVVDSPRYQRAEVVERYIRQYHRRSSVGSQRQLSSNRPETSIHIPFPIGSKWLATAKERVRGSIAPKGHEAENDGRWVTQDIADAAIVFFKTTSDLLPEEPFIYSSQKGDLVAEVSAKHGTITSIISEAFVLLFAVVDGFPIEKRLLLGNKTLSALRAEVRQLTKMLRTGRHGAVDTTTR